MFFSNLIFLHKWWGFLQRIQATKAIKVEMYYKLDIAFYLWFRQQREKGILVTGQILLEKATAFSTLKALSLSKQVMVINRALLWK